MSGSAKKKNDLLQELSIDKNRYRFINHPKMKTDFMQTVNLLTMELQLRVEGSDNNFTSLFK